VQKGSRKSTGVSTRPWGGLPRTEGLRKKGIGSLSAGLKALREKKVTKRNSAGSTAMEGGNIREKPATRGMRHSRQQGLRPQPEKKRKPSSRASADDPLLTLKNNFHRNLHGKDPYHPNVKSLTKRGLNTRTVEGEKRKICAWSAKYEPGHRKEGKQGIQKIGGGVSFSHQQRGSAEVSSPMWREWGKEANTFESASIPLKRRILGEGSWQ